MEASINEVFGMWFFSGGGENSNVSDVLSDIVLRMYEVCYM